MNNFNPIKFLLLLCCLSGLTANAQLSQVVIEPYALTSPTSIQPAGTTTYRLYAEMQQSTDKVSAVFATLGCHALDISTTTTFFNDGFGVVSGSAINAAFFAFFPTYEADS